MPLIVKGVCPKAEKDATKGTNKMIFRIETA
jgi:hypothetical protein